MEIGKRHNTTESKDSGTHRKPDFSENSGLRFDVRGVEQKIRQRGYHVLCKEDFRSEALLKSHNTSVDKPNSDSSSNLNNSDMEFRGENASTSNGENSGESFSLDASKFIVEKRSYFDHNDKKKGKKKVRQLFKQTLQALCGDSCCFCPDPFRNFLCEHEIQ